MGYPWAGVHGFGKAERDRFDRRPLPIGADEHFVSAEFTAAIARSTSNSEVRQLQTLTRMARWRQVVPPKYAPPSCSAQHGDSPRSNTGTARVIPHTLLQSAWCRSPRLEAALKAVLHGNTGATRGNTGTARVIPHTLLQSA